MDRHMKGIAILGSTGSIGQQTLDIVRAFPQEFRVVALSAWDNRDLLLRQAREFKPNLLFGQSLSLKEGDAPPGCKVVRDLADIVSDSHVEMVVLAVVGGIGLMPALQ